MSMGLSALRADLRASLSDTASVFDDAALDRILRTAALDLGRKRRRTLAGSLSLVAGQAEYPAPADLIQPTMSCWGVNERAASRPWLPTWPGRLPRMRVVGDAADRRIVLTPAPTAGQIRALGASFRYYYLAAHIVDQDPAKTTVNAADRGLLLLRAQAEAMKELAMRNSKKPVQLRDGLNAAPKNGTPAALYEQLMRSFEAQA